jgi:DNA (cytosine-5)-methyltransferase 1
MWILAYGESNNPRRLSERAITPDSGLIERYNDATINGWGGATLGWTAEPSVGRVVHGMAHWVDRIEAFGNGQVPRVAVAAFSQLKTD